MGDRKLGHMHIHGLYVLGYSMSEIGRELHLSRSAVAGWVHRHRHELPRRDKAKGKAKAKRAAVAARPALPAVRRLGPIAAVVAPRLVVPNAVPASKQKMREEIAQALANTAALPVRR